MIEHQGQRQLPEEFIMVCGSRVTDLQRGGVIAGSQSRKLVHHTSSTYRKYRMRTGSGVRL